MNHMKNELLKNSESRFEKYFLFNFIDSIQFTVFNVIR